MATEHILIDDILKNQTERMLYLKKYYPFFVLQETTLSQYKEGKFQDLDMGYITMALLRFLIQENHFNGRTVSYPEVEKFLCTVIRRDFELSVSREEETELVRFLFDKIRNDGRPFVFPFYDPESHTKQQGYVRLVESAVKDGDVVYSITSDGIEFYLSTKEVRDESTITTEQLLLEKMIRTENFRGGIDVVRRINLEVARLRKEREDTVRLLQSDLHAGVRACEAYMAQISEWFDAERESFRKNKALVDKAVARMTANPSYSGDDATGGQSTGADGRTVAAGRTGGAGTAVGTTDRNSAGASSPRKKNAFRDIAALETELKKTIESHRLLMEEAASLSQMADEMVERGKARQLRPAFDFQAAMRLLQEKDAPEQMGQVLAPFLLPRRRKSLSVFSIDKLVNEAREDEDLTETRETGTPDLSFEYEDEVLSRMIGQNFVLLFRELLERLERWETVTLPEFNAILEIKFGKEIYRNRDYYSFLVHLAKKDSYSMKECFEEPETFLELYVSRSFSEEEKQRFRGMTLTLTYGDEDVELKDDLGTSLGSVREMTFSMSS